MQTLPSNARLVIGVDPGSVETGIVVLGLQDEDTPLQLLHHETMRREINQSTAKRISIYDYVRALNRKIQSLIDQHNVNLIAFEDLIPMGRGNTKIMMEVGFVVGFLTAHFDKPRCAAIAVSPKGHGKKSLSEYPLELVSDAEKRDENWEKRVGPHGKMRHERSAWDIAITGLKAFNEITY